MIEFRVQGPPGTGKTYYLKNQIERAAAKYGARFITVCSLTRTAAANIAGAGPAIPRENIGTIHSLAFRAVGASTIAESKISAFNEFCVAEKMPAMKLSPASGVERTGEAAVQKDDLYTAGKGETLGDRDLADMNRRRARLAPIETWPASVRGFAQVWNRFKSEAKALDFTDLLEIALRDVDECPGKPAALFCDESQDFSRLAFALARKWGEKCLGFIHVGDPDQILFEWAGVDPGAFFESKLPPERSITLHKSYRVPKAVHALAVRWIEQTPGRRVVAYKPTDVEGEIRRDVGAKYRDPIPAIRDAEKYLAAGKSVMFCASCSYMLDGIIKSLREEGIPFHNPYRVTRGDWNPLTRGTAGRVTAVDRLLSFVRVNPSIMGASRASHWTNADVARWVEWIKTQPTLVRGAKTAAEAWAAAAPDEMVDVESLVSLFTSTDDAELAIDADLDWFARVLSEEGRRKLDYPADVVKKRGAAALESPPQVIVTTVHAVKGGEADVVYVFPDLSPQAHNEWLRGGGGREGVRRTFYVALTRARETLVICKPSSGMSVNL
jgi:DNA helicase-2/ATP-dependent DNA helicase PcrA